MALTDLTRISTSGIATGTSLSGAILHGDAHFRGTQVGVNSAIFDSSDDALELNDNVKLKFGNSGDLSIYHNGSDNYIDGNSNAEDHLYIRANVGADHSSNIHLQAKSGEDSIVCRDDESVELHFNGNQKLRTTNHGAVVTGILTATSFSGPLISSPINNPSGISTFYDLRVSNNLTVEGSTTTLDTNLIGVDRVEVGANSNSIVGVAVTQSGTADIVNLFDGSTEIVEVASSTNAVKITHTGGYGLQVKRGSKFIDINGDWATSGNAALNAGDSGIRFYYGASSDGIQFNTGTGTDKVRILSNGNVGIGTDTAPHKLSVKGTISMISGASATQIVNISQDGSNNGYIAVNDSTGTTRARLDSSGVSYVRGGNFGVGTNNPNYKTVIQTSDTTAYSASTITANQFQLAISNSGANGVAGILLATEPSSGNGGHCGIRALSTGNGSSDLTFSTRGSSTSGERLRITSDGKIGVNYAGTPPSETMMIASADSTTGLSISHSSGGNRYGARLSTISGTNKGLIISNIFNSSYAEVFRINSNGDVTTTGQASFDRQNAGFTARAGDSVSITRASGTPLELNRTGSDGQMIALIDDNSIEASIGLSSGSLVIGLPNSGTERLRIGSSGGVGISTTLIRNSDFLHIATASQDYSNSSTELADGGGIMFQPTDTLPSTNRTYPGIFWSGNTSSLGRIRAGIIGVTAANNDATHIVFLTRHAANGTGFYPTDEKMRIDNTGKVLIGHTSSPTSDSDRLQVISTVSGTGLCLHNYSASAYGNQIAFMKSRSNTIGTNTVLNAYDRIGELNFYGNDGSGRSLGAQIQVRTDGTTTNDNTPAYFAFNTGTNQSMQTRLRISSSGVSCFSKTHASTGVVEPGNFILNVHTGAELNDGIKIVTNYNSGNQNSDSGKLMFCGEGQSNGIYIYKDNAISYGKGDMVFHTRSTANDYTTQLAETARFTAYGRFGLGTGGPGQNTVDSLMHIQGNSDNGDEHCQLTIEDEDTTAGSKIPSIQFKGNGTNTCRIRGTDTSGITFATWNGSSQILRSIIGNMQEGGAFLLNADDRGWATFRHNHNQGLRTHIRQHYAPGNAVSTYKIMRIRRHNWGWGTYKITLKALYYYGSHETTYYVNGHGAGGGDNYSIQKRQYNGHNMSNDYGAATVTKTSASTSSPGNSSTSYIDVQVNVPNYMYLIVYIEAYSSQYSTDPSNVGTDSYCLSP